MAKIEKTVLIKAIINVDEDYDINSRLLLAVDTGDREDYDGSIVAAKTPEFEVVEYLKFEIKDV